MTSVRVATLDDIPALVEMGAAMRAESPRYRSQSFDPAKVTQIAHQLIPTKGVGVAERDGKIIGMMAGVVVPTWFGHDLMATDLVLYVKPEHRKTTRAALLLIRAFEAWAEERGAVDIMPGVSTMVEVEGTVGLYEKLGYERYGAAMIKRLK